MMGYDAFRNGGRSWRLLRPVIAIVPMFGCVNGGGV